MSLLAVLCLFSGCEDMKEPVAMREWYFEEGKEECAMYFGILNYNEEYISAEVDAEITILNDNGEIVYKEKKALTEADFGEYEDSFGDGIEYLARVSIPRNEILKGRSEEGRVCLQVYQNGKELFPAVYANAYSLPKLKPKIKCEELPRTIVSAGYYKNSDSELLLSGFSYTVNEGENSAEVVLSGEVIREGETFFDWYYARAFDSEGKLFDSAQLSYEGLSAGDTYSTSFTLYNLTPGEEYTIIFEEYN